MRQAPCAPVSHPGGQAECQGTAQQTHCRPRLGCKVVWQERSEAGKPCGPTKQNQEGDCSAGTSSEDSRAGRYRAHRTAQVATITVDSIGGWRALRIS